jgi:hypothetical protein
MRVGQTLPYPGSTAMAERANGNAPKKANGGITKIEAVKQALSKLGKDATRPDIQKFVKDNYRVEMTLDHISNCKGELRKKKGHAKKSVAQQPTAGKHEPKQPTPAPRSHGISLTDIEAVKDLVERVGAESLRQLIGVLAR